MEHRDDVSRDPLVPRIGDNAGLEPQRSAAGRPLLVQFVYGGGLAVRGVAGTVHARAGGGLAGEVRRDLLGRDHGGAALVVGGVGFCDSWSSRGLFKTEWPVPADPA